LRKNVLIITIKMLNKLEAQYWDGTLNWDIQSKYSDIVNMELTKVPYSNRKRNTSFALKTRKGFRPVFDRTTVTNLPNYWEITDVIELDWKKYIMRVDQLNYMKMRIYRIDGCAVTQIGKDQCIEPKWDHRFIKTKYVKGKPRYVYNNGTNFELWTWTQINKYKYEVSDISIVNGETRQAKNTYNWTVPFETSWPIALDKDLNTLRQIVNIPPDWQFKVWTTDNPNLWQPLINTDSSFNWVEIGDYILVYWVDWSYERWTTATHTQVNIVTGFLDSLNLDVRNAWAGFMPSQEFGFKAKFRIYPDWWDVFVIDTCDWLKLWTWDMDWDPSEDFLHLWFTDEQSQFVEYNNWIITYVNDLWYLRYGGFSTLQFFTDLSKEIFLWPDVLAIPVYQQYTLVFKKNSLSVVQFNQTETWDIIYQYNPTNLNIWLWNYWRPYDSFRNWFYFVWNDKRLYALSVQPTSFWTYHVDLEDMSAMIKGYLDNIGKTDRVYTQATEQYLRIFMVWDYDDNMVYNKTQILLYEKDYQFRHRRTSDVCVITGHREWFYIWNDIYNQCWYSDRYDYDTGEWYIYDCFVESYLGENEVSSPVNMFQSKNMSEWMFILWSWSYLTNWSFYTELLMHTNSLKLTFRLEDCEWNWTEWSGIDYVKLLKEFRSWNLVKPSDDMKQLITASANYSRPCSWSWVYEQMLVTSDLCNCPDEKPTFDDFWLCIDDRAYFISDFSSVKFHLKWSENWSKLFRLRIGCKSDNILEYLWFLIPYYVNLPEDVDTFYKNERQNYDCFTSPCDCDNRWWPDCAILS